jgi:hypothetical protein
MPTCDICLGACSNNFSLKRHVRTVHGSEHHRCRDCPKTYARYDNLRKHRRKCHQEVHDTETHQLLPVVPSEPDTGRGESLLSARDYCFDSSFVVPVSQTHGSSLEPMNFLSTAQHSKALATAVQEVETGQDRSICPSFDRNNEAPALEAWYADVHNDVSQCVCTVLMVVLIHMTSNSFIQSLHMSCRRLSYQTLRERAMKTLACCMKHWSWTQIQVFGPPCHLFWSTRFKNFVKSTPMYNSLRRCDFDLSLHSVFRLHYIEQEPSTQIAFRLSSVLTVQRKNALRYRHLETSDQSGSIWTPLSTA